jgi:hypothetical protein
MNESHGSLCGQSRGYELRKKKPQNVAVHGTDFFAHDNLNAEPRVALGVFVGSKGSFERIVVGDGDHGEAPPGSGFDHLAWRVEPIGKISVNVAVGVSHDKRKLKV